MQIECILKDQIKGNKFKGIKWRLSTLKGQRRYFLHRCIKYFCFSKLNGISIGRIHHIIHIKNPEN